MTQDKLVFDHIGYARCHGLWVGRRKYQDGPTHYWLVRGDYHPHDPDGQSERVVGPPVHTEEEAIEWAKNTRRADLQKELDELSS